MVNDTQFLLILKRYLEEAEQAGENVQKEVLIMIQDRWQEIRDAFDNQPN